MRKSVLIACLLFILMTLGVGVSPLSLSASNINAKAADTKNAETKKDKEKRYTLSDLLPMAAEGGKEEPGKEKTEKEKSEEKQIESTEDTVLALVGLDETNEIKTFDDKKSFSGNAEKGTEITATVYVPADKTEWKEAKTYSQTVGASGIFNITVDFNLGENIVIVKAAKGTKITQRAFTVKRKDSEIRDRLLIESPLLMPIKQK